MDVGRTLGALGLGLGVGALPAAAAAAAPTSRALVGSPGAPLLMSQLSRYPINVATTEMS